METLNIIDALGDKIIVGNSYGYSISKSGFAHTLVGTAIQETKTGRVTLKVTNVKHFLYGKPIDDYRSAFKDKVSIFPHLIFPVNNDFYVMHRN